MNKREMDKMESELREQLMKERWRLTAEQEAGELPYASNKEIADEKIGKWLSAALEDPATCGAMKDDINEWFRAVEEERLRSKKKSIHDELMHHMDSIATLVSLWVVMCANASIGSQIGNQMK